MNPAKTTEPQKRRPVAMIVVFLLVLVAGLAGVFYFRSHGRKTSPVAGSHSTNLRGAVVAADLIRESERSLPSRSVPANAATLDQRAGDALRRQDAREILAIGREYEKGVAGNPPDLAQARRMFNAAAALGDAEAMYRSGFYAEHGLGGKADGNSAKDWYDRAGHAGYADGYAAVAKMYMEGQVVVPDQHLAAKYIELGIQAGSSEAKFLKGISLLDLSPNSAGALELLQQAAAAGNANAQQMISRLYRDGGLLPKDEAKAIEWARRAAESGAAGARVDLANLLLGSPTGANAAVAKDAIENLLSADSNQNARAALEMARLSMAAPVRDGSDVELTRQYAVKAFEGGEMQGAFIAALTYALTDQSAEAEQWLAKGTLADDWRSRYARSLMEKSGFSLREALTTAMNATVGEYQAIRALNSPKSRNGITPPSPIVMTMPVFPAGLEMLSTNGAVTVEFVVNEKGNPTGIQVLNVTHPQLAATTVAAVSHWKYEPATRNGSAVPLRVRVPIKFKSTP